LQFGGVFSQKSKIPKNDRFKKVKIERKKEKKLKIEKLMSNIIYNIFIV
jgi:hypothetical protein